MLVQAIPPPKKVGGCIPPSPPPPGIYAKNLETCDSSQCFVGKYFCRYNKSSCWFKYVGDTMMALLMTRFITTSWKLEKINKYLFN